MFMTFNLAFNQTFKSIIQQSTRQSIVLYSATDHRVLCGKTSGEVIITMQFY